MEKAEQAAEDKDTSVTKEEVKDQVTILYYEDNDNFAFSVATKDGDEVIFAKGVKGKTFAKIYEEIEKSADEYTGSEKMEEKDTLKIPNLKFNMLKEYKELEKNHFSDWIVCQWILYCRDLTKEIWD